ncbi:MAG: anthranilate phosphoribosyltransferase, partial [Nitriliruptorales bacterium]
PASLGLPRARLEDLQGGEVDDNRRIADAVLDGEEGPTADVVALNAGAALYVAEAVPTIAAGVDHAREALRSGAARRLRDRWAARTGELAAAGGIG